MKPCDDPNFGLVDKVVCPVTRKLYELMKTRGPEPVMMATLPSSEPISSLTAGG